MNRPTLSIAISSSFGSTLLLSAQPGIAPMPASAPAAESGSAASSWTEAPAEESAVRGLNSVECVRRRE
ncbi:MAG: hypothetical protein R2851_13695 [Caldilineaceae bacterium]